MNEELQKRHADIAGRMQQLMTANRSKLAAIIEEHRAAVALLEEEGEAFWAAVYAQYPILGAMPDRMYIDEDNKTIVQGFPYSGVPFAFFDKTEEEVTHDDEASDAPDSPAPVETTESTGIRIKAFINTIFEDA